MSRQGEVALALLLVGVVAVAVVAGRRRAPATERDDRPSTFVQGPYGSEAVYAVLLRLGRSIDRRRTPLFGLASDTARRPDVLVVAAPRLPLESGELDAVARYALGGGAVFAAGFGGGITACAGWAVRSVGRLGRGDRSPVISRGVARALPAVGRVLTRRDRAAGAGTPAACDAWRPTAVDTLLRTRDHRPVLLALHYAGGGRVMLLSEPDYLRNVVWRDSDVPYLLVPLLAPAGAHVTWDEYHQGFGKAPSLAGAVATWLTRAPAGWALLHLLLAALVALGVAALRFGPPRAFPRQSQRRSPLEHVEALAAGLEGAGGSATAIRLIVGGLRRRLQRTPGGARGDPITWLAALPPALPDAQGRAAVNRLRDIATHSGGPQQVLAAAQVVEDVWEQLHLRRTHA